MIGVTYKNHIKNFKYFEDFIGNKKANSKLLSHLRFIVYNGDLQFIGKYLNPQVGNIKTCKSLKRKLTLPAVSIDNEVKMLTRLKKIAEECLKEYSESYEKDEKLLESGAKLSFNERNIIVLRMGDKKVVCFLL